MSFFKKAHNNANKLSEKLLGPPYDYKGKVKGPGALGMSDKGTLQALGKDVRGLIGYSDILTRGGGVASRVNGALGNKFFLKTGMKCISKKTGKSVNRYIYMNNVPNAPLAGLIKGTTTGIDSLNPYRIMGSFGAGADPICRPISLEVIDNNNSRRRETHYMTLNDIKYLRQGFSNMELEEDPLDTSDEIQLPEDIYIQAYYVFLATFGIYVIYKLMGKK